MILVPSERAVLGQIQDIFLVSSVRSYRINSLMARWPVLDFQAYRDGYAGLISKGLISKSVDDQVFTITNAGLKAMLWLSHGPVRRLLQSQA
jgi:hypothetical protein